MKVRSLITVAFAASTVARMCAGTVAPPPAWDQAAAARYLDSRAVWWQAWPAAQRDHGTVCISCHSALPYALARPALRQQSGEAELTAPEQVLFHNVARRVTLWNEVEPFYKDGEAGPTKSIESRDTEAVMNALILADHDAHSGHLTEVTRAAFRNAWALQQTTGEKAGGWIWLNFHNAPWESDESEYQGAVMAALAVGLAPGHYSQSSEVRPNVTLLRSYLRRHYNAQPLVNRLLLLWASARLPGLLNPEERAALVQDVLAAQQADGGWSLTRLGTWKRHDGTPLDTRSDGYATGLTVLALEATSTREAGSIDRGRMWLLRNQSATEGLWPAWSLNKQRDPASGVGRFMSDAATGFAVLALENGR